jgi:hypothetical protein
MRRIATLVATGAVAAAAVVGLGTSSASASTTAAASFDGGTAATVAAGEISPMATHNWHSYNGSSTIYGYGTYSHTSSRTTVYGYVKDSRSGSYYAGVYIRWYDAGNKHYDYKILYNKHHHSTAKFPAKYYSSKHSHLYIAEILVHKTSKGWELGPRGHFHKYF